MKIRVWQISRERDSKCLAFLNYKNTASKTGRATIDRSIYDCMFTGDVQAESLEEVFTMFNLRAMPGADAYIGRSISVSDVIEVIEETGSVAAGAYFVDSIGVRSVDFAATPERIEMPIGNGRVLTAELSRNRYFKEIYLGLETDDGQQVQELALVGNAYKISDTDCSVEQEDRARVCVYGNANQEDYTHIFTIDYREGEVGDDENRDC